MPIEVASVPFFEVLAFCHCLVVGPITEPRYMARRFSMRGSGISQSSATARTLRRRSAANAALPVDAALCIADRRFRRIDAGFRCGDFRLCCVDPLVRLNDPCVLQFFLALVVDECVSNVVPSFRRSIARSIGDARIEQAGQFLDDDGAVKHSHKRRILQLDSMATS